MIGMMMSPTSELTMAPNAAPMITPMARSTTLPRRANFLKSSSMGCPPRASFHRTTAGLSAGETHRGRAGMIDAHRLGFAQPILPSGYDSNFRFVELVDQPRVHHGVAHQRLR